MPIESIPVKRIANGSMGQDNFVEGNSIGCSKPFPGSDSAPSIRRSQTRPLEWQRQAFRWCKSSTIRFALHNGQPRTRLCRQGVLDSRQLTQKDLAVLLGRTLCKEVSSEGLTIKSPRDSAHSNDHFIKNSLLIWERPVHSEYRVNVDQERCFSFCFV